MEFKGQLLQLVRLQDVVLESRTARQLVEESPARIEQIEQDFRERNAEYVAVKQRYDALEEDQRLRNGELQQLEEQHKKYKADLMQVQNQREYAAILREIDAIKASISEHESAILRDMEEIETAKSDLQSHEEHISAERDKVASERQQVQTAAEAARTKIEDLADERKKIEATLPRPLRKAVARLEAGRAGQFLAAVEDGVCQSCFVRVRPQVFQEIKLASKLHYCSNCKRLLFHEPTVKAMAEEETSGSQDAPSSSNSVEAMNGGAV